MLLRVELKNRENICRVVEERYEYRSFFHNTSLQLKSRTEFEIAYRTEINVMYTYP